MKEKKIEGLLGMAQRAGKTASGDVAIRKAIASGQAAALLVAEDVSERTRASLQKEATEKKIPFYAILTKDVLGRCLGKEVRAAVALLDQGFAKALEKELRGQ